MDAADISAIERRSGAWRDELRATLALAWPLILANLTQQLIQATDVLLMGRLGATPARGGDARAQPDLHLQPADARAGHRLLADDGDRARPASNAVRDVRRTFRAGLWLIAIMLPPYWLVLWHVGRSDAAFGQSAELAQQGQTFLRAYMWCTAPWLLFQLLRNFVSALERPRVVLWLSLAGIARQRAAELVVDLRPFRPARARTGRRRTRQHVDLACHVRRADRRSSCSTGSSAVFTCSAIGGGFDGQRTLAMIRLGWPIGVTMALEMGVFALAAYFMGWIGAPAVAAHAVALQLAALTFMVPLGLGQAATVRVGLALGRGDDDGIARAGWTAWVDRRRVHGRRWRWCMWSIPRTLVTLFLDDVPANAVVIALAVSFLRVAAAFQLVDGAQVIGAGMLRGLHDTRWPLLFALVGYWVVGLGIGAWLAFAATGRASASGSVSPAGSPPSPR